MNSTKSAGRKTNNRSARKITLLRDEWCEQRRGWPPTFIGRCLLVWVGARPSLWIPSRNVEQRLFELSKAVRDANGWTALLPDHLLIRRPVRIVGGYVRVRWIPYESHHMFGRPDHAWKPEYGFTPLPLHEAEPKIAAVLRQRAAIALHASNAARALGQVRADSRAARYARAEVERLRMLEEGWPLHEITDVRISACTGIPVHTIRRDRAEFGEVRSRADSRSRADRYARAEAERVVMLEAGCAPHEVTDAKISDATGIPVHTIRRDRAEFGEVRPHDDSRSRADRYARVEAERTAMIEAGCAPHEVTDAKISDATGIPVHTIRRDRAEFGEDAVDRRAARTDQILDLHAQGHSGRAISRETGIPIATVQRVIRKARQGGDP